MKGSSTFWKEIKDKLKANVTNLNNKFVNSQKEKSKILRSRAKSLATEEHIDQNAVQIKVVEFLLANEKYAIEESYIQEVYPIKNITPVPCTPEFVTGIINIRGRILSIIDLKKFFDLPEKGLGYFNKVLVLKSDKMELGILADIILGVKYISTNEIQSSLPTLTGIRDDYLKGITKSRLVILDAVKLMSDKKILVHEKVEN